MAGVAGNPGGRCGTAFRRFDSIAIRAFIAFAGKNLLENRSNKNPVL